MFGFLFILFCVAAYFHYQHHGCNLSQKFNAQRDALDIVRERYARGEIDSEEFNERIKILKEGRH